MVLVFASNHVVLVLVSNPAVLVLVLILPILVLVLNLAVLVLISTVVDPGYLVGWGEGIFCGEILITFFALLSLF